MPFKWFISSVTLFFKNRIPGFLEAGIPPTVLSPDFIVDNLVVSDTFSSSQRVICTNVTFCFRMLSLVLWNLTEKNLVTVSNSSDVGICFLRLLSIDYQLIPPVLIVVLLTK